MNPMWLSVKFWLTRTELIQVMVSLDTEYMTVFPSLSLKMLLQEAAEKKRVKVMAAEAKLALMADVQLSFLVLWTGSWELGNLYTRKSYLFFLIGGSKVKIGTNSMSFL